MVYVVILNCVCVCVKFEFDRRIFRLFSIWMETCFSSPFIWVTFFLKYVGLTTEHNQIIDGLNGPINRGFTSYAAECKNVWCPLLNVVLIFHCDLHKTLEWYIRAVFIVVDRIYCLLLPFPPHSIFHVHLRTTVHHPTQLYVLTLY